MDQRERYQVVTGGEWDLRGAVGGAGLREHRTEAALLDGQWRELQRQQDELLSEREAFQRRSEIIVVWELLGFALIVLLGILMMLAGNGMLPR